MASENDLKSSATTTKHIGKPIAKDDQKEEDELDEEGLLKNGYDVILCGTGLTHSILAAALARAGKKILHCDSNDFYGDIDAVLSFDALNEWKSQVENRPTISMHDEEIDGQITLQPSESYASLRIDSTSNAARDTAYLKEGMKVVTPYGRGTLLNTPGETNDAASVKVHLNHWTMADGKSPIAYFGKDQSTEDAEIISMDTMIFSEYIEKRQRSFALDLSPALLFANGDAVDGLIKSCVSEYCEFKSIIGLHLFMKKQQKKSRSSKDEGMKSSLSKVPCSKRDVFQTKLLPPLDKRRLMKFLQLASDYALSVQTQQVQTIVETERTDDGSSIASLNERQLQQGRSLYRPQNKKVATNDLEILQQCIKDDMSFEKYLKEHHTLSDDMMKIVIHAMAMGACNGNQSEYSTRDGMNDLCQHLQALGKFGSTAFLAPLYGSGELSQAFCRSAAVHGGTYLLRRGPKCIKMNESGTACGVVLNGCCYDGNIEVPEKFIAAKNVILPSQMMKGAGRRDGALTYRIHRRISILRGKLVKNDDTESEITNEQRYVIVVPPEDEGIGNTSLIHGLALDESVNIAPYPINGVDTTILYLSTLGNPSEEGINHTKVLANAVSTLCGDDCVELYQLGYSYEVDSECCNTDQISGIHLCRSRGMTLAVDSSFVEAKRIFHELCPDDNFLKLSTEMDELVKERQAGFGDDEDEEFKMLESAMNLISASDSNTDADESSTS
jgi:RAB protein geranylgeranyltransferase component A